MTCCRRLTHLTVIWCLLFTANVSRHGRFVNFSFLWSPFILRENLKSEDAVLTRKAPPLWSEDWRVEKWGVNGSVSTASFFYYLTFVGMFWLSSLSVCDWRYEDCGFSSMGKEEITTTSVSGIPVSLSLAIISRFCQLRGHFLLDFSGSSIKFKISMASFLDFRLKTGED